MPEVSIAETEYQKEVSDQQDRDLSNRIFKHNNPKKLRKISQFVRFGEELIIAISTSQNEALLSSGSVGTLRIAHPVRKDGSIDTNTELMVKLMNGSAVAANEQEIKYYKRTKAEAENGNHAFSCRMTIIPRPQKEDGKTIYDTAMVMSKVPGIPLNTAVHTRKFRKLSPAQRLYLCINILSFFIYKLHQNNIFQGDVKAENFLVNLKALMGTAVDIEPCHNTKETKAPEAEISDLSDTYSIAQDILTPILIGIRLLVDKKGKILNESLVLPELRSYFPGHHYDLYDLLKGMQEAHPQERIPLVQALSTFEAIFKAVAKKPVVNEKILRAQQKHHRQLRVLETLLDNPDYKPTPLAAKPPCAKKYGFFQSVPSSGLISLCSERSTLSMLNRN